MKNQNAHPFTFPITSQLVDDLKQTIIPHPEYPEETITKIEFFIYHISLLQTFLQEILSQAPLGYDIDITPNIFYNCDDQNYLITTEITIFK